MYHSKDLPLPAAERGIDRTGCALLRRLMGALSVPLQNHSQRLVIRRGDAWKRKFFTHPFLRKRYRRWAEALPAPFVDKSLLLLTRFLVYDSSNGGHRICFKTDMPNHDRRT